MVIVVIQQRQQRAQQVQARRQQVQLVQVLLVQRQQQQVLQIESELRTAFIEYEWAISNVRFERRNTVESQQMSRILSDALKAGRYTPLEQREMQFTIMQAKSRALEAQLNYITARMNIALATGDFKQLLP